MIRDQFQVTADAFGNLRVAAGWVLQPRHDVAIRVASFEDSGLPNSQPLEDGSRWPAMGPQNSTFVGGSGRNVIVTGLGASTLVPVGFYLPGQAGKYGCVNGPFTIIPGAGTYDISDGTAVLATGALTLAPFGDYVATSYGETTYGGSATFTLTAAAESGSVGIPGLAVSVSAGSAAQGEYNPMTTATWESDGDSNWTVEIAADGTAGLYYLSTAMATRAAGPLDDPSGVYEATADGQTDCNGGAPWSAFITAIRIAPRAGWVYLSIAESSGAVNSVTGPFFTPTLPTHSGSVFYYPIAHCDGYNAPEQIHLGPVHWDRVGTDGIMTVGGLLLSDTVWDDIRINSGGFELLGSADPAFVNFQPGGSGATLKLWEFAKNDEVNCSAQMPHGYKPGTNLKIHIHWTPGKYGVAQRNAKVGWKVDVTAAQYGHAFAPCVTLDLSDTVAADCANDQHLIGGSVEFTVPTGFKESGMVLMRVYRSDTGADDTWSETLSGRLPMLLEIDIHHQIEKIGSANEIPD